MEKRLLPLIKDSIMYEILRAKRDSCYADVFGTDLCGFSRRFGRMDLDLRLKPLMPFADFAMINIDDNRSAKPYVDPVYRRPDVGRGTSTDSYLTYNSRVEALKAMQGHAADAARYSRQGVLNFDSKYLVTFVSDACMKHMSVIFHTWAENEREKLSYQERVIYFNTGPQEELRNFVQYYTHREVVFLDYEYLQKAMPKSKADDRFCILHSALFAYRLYQAFEGARGRPPRAWKLNTPGLDQKAPRRTPMRPFRWSSDVHPIYRAHVDAIFANKSTEPVLGTFLAEMKAAQANNIDKYVCATPGGVVWNKPPNWRGPWDPILKRYNENGPGGHSVYYNKLNYTRKYVQRERLISVDKFPFTTQRELLSKLLQKHDTSPSVDPIDPSFDPPDDIMDKKAMESELRRRQVKGSLELFGNWRPVEVHRACKPPADGGGVETGGPRPRYRRPGGLGEANTNTNKNKNKRKGAGKNKFPNALSTAPTVVSDARLRHGLLTHIHASAQANAQASTSGRGAPR